MQDVLITSVVRTAIGKLDDGMLGRMKSPRQDRGEGSTIISKKECISKSYQRVLVGVLL